MKGVKRCKEIRSGDRRKDKIKEKRCNEDRCKRDRYKKEQV